MTPLRLGIIGTGVAARELHWPALKRMPERYEIVAVANRTRPKAEAFADMIGLARSHVYSDYRQLVARDDVEAVLLALPPALNYEAARAAAEAGCHIICEKPLADSLPAAGAMLTLPQEFGVRLLVAENFRYDPALQQAKELLNEGRIKPPFMLAYQFTQPVPPDDEIATRPWRQKPTHPGGMLSDHGVHMIDAVRFLMGEIEAVQVFARDLAEHVGGLDTAVYNLRFGSGAIGSIQWSFKVGAGPVSLIQLFAEDGTLQIRPDALRLQRQDQPDERLAVDGPDSFFTEFADFHTALVKGTVPQMTAQDGLNDLAVVEAAYRSAMTGKLIKV